ncbi:hypothetical protein OROHE_009646 [Orobanche hederae]
MAAEDLPSPIPEASKPIEEDYFGDSDDGALTDTDQAQITDRTEGAESPRWPPYEEMLWFPNTYMLVGCCNDETTHKYKGKTVMTESERYESLRHCKWVDEVIPDAPWVFNQEFLDEHHIDFVAHDSLPYADASGAGNDVYEFVKAVGRFKETKRTDGISTSDIIMTIVKDYNQYVMRNLDRGYSRKELNLSYEKRLRVNMRLKKLQEKVKEHQEKVGEKGMKYGLHKVVKKCEKAIVLADPTVTSLGPLQQAHVYDAGSSHCAAFLSNYDTQSAAKVLTDYFS